MDFIRSGFLRGNCSDRINRTIKKHASVPRLRRADRAITSFEMAAEKDIATDRERLKG
jgi:hypothetical protein